MPSLTPPPRLVSSPSPHHSLLPFPSTLNTTLTHRRRHRNTKITGSGADNGNDAPRADIVDTDDLTMSAKMYSFLEGDKKSGPKIHKAGVVFDYFSISLILLNVISYALRCEEGARDGSRIVVCAGRLIRVRVEDPRILGRERGVRGFPRRANGFTMWYPLAVDKSIT